jgi:SAM-dependent methyltransferase
MFGRRTLMTSSPGLLSGLSPKELRYYLRTEAWNAKFWGRMVEPISLRSARCLDLGCGVGALTTDLVRRGAEHAVGIDPNEDRIRVARIAAQALHPDVADRVDFLARTIQSLEGRAAFDVVVSRDTFEHIHDLPEVLVDVARLLKPDGRVYVGFGPLYRSPFGDHGLLGLRIPWAHLICAPMPDTPRFGSWPSRRRLDHLARELNGHRLAEIEAIVERSPLEAVSWKVNVSGHPAARLLSLGRAVPALREFVALNVYAELQHRRDV